MNPVRIVSASAGSGKTTRLVRELTERLGAGAVRPEAVLATTFTVKAAAELRSRTRAALLSAGKFAEAHRLASARIGTVNAVCGALVQDFAFELGLSPDLRVLDENLAAEALTQSLARVVTPAEMEELARLAEHFGNADGKLDWQKWVRQIVDLARSNAIPPEALAECARRSEDGFAALLGAAADDPAEVDRRLEDALRAFVGVAAANGDATDKTRTALTLARKSLACLERGGLLPWKDWAALAKLNPAKKSLPLADPVHLAAAVHDRHPRLRAEGTWLIRFIFGAAARALQAYADDKRAWGVLDFVDQETLALRLLADETVRERLRGEIELVLVDEFQDTSPLQLAVFLQLAEIARESVWVGDQKQAIYGFRGTDPRLMDDAVASLLAGAEPETLPTSYRSRDGLVQLTSQLFAPAFGSQQIPESRVRLAAHRQEPATGGGPCLELWDLQGKGQVAARALAAAVEDLLADPSVRVQDRATLTWRPPRPGEVAILCFRNDTGAEVAAALQERGIPAVLPRVGLLSTPEGVLARAGLRLWIDPADTLAAACLARLARCPADGDAWLQALLADGREAFTDQPLARRLRESRAVNPAAGAVAALDLVLDVLEAREWCLAWGDAPQRLANLDALRAHAVRYAEACAARGGGSTAAGLAAHLESLADRKEDSQGVPQDLDAVYVSTWHKAKGLEWPVTILLEPPAPRANPGLGVHLAAREGGFDLGAPLAGRWVRFWPNPYRFNNTGQPFLDRLAASAENGAASRSAVDERLRLLYVGWTRARDLLVLAGGEGTLDKGSLALLPGGARRVWEPAGGGLVWDGVPVWARQRPGVPREPRVRPPDPGEAPVASGPRWHPEAWRRPSAVVGEGTAGEPVRLGERLTVHGNPDMDRLGNAVHGFFAADDPALRPEARVALANDLLARWGVATAVDPAALVAAADAFHAWLASTWPGAVSRREWPVRHRMEETPPAIGPTGTDETAPEGQAGQAVQAGSDVLAAPARFTNPEARDGAEGVLAEAANAEVLMSATDREGGLGKTVLAGSADLVLEAEVLTEGANSSVSTPAADRAGGLGKTVLAGSADLVLETREGLVVIDHKSFPGRTDEALHRAASHRGQLRAYAAALTAATGRPVCSTWIHLPLLGLVVPVGD